jgi:hypothetical protein
LTEWAPERIAEKLAAAEAATPGPWDVDEQPGDTSPMVMQAYGINGHIAYATGFQDDDQASADFAYIAAMNPKEGKSLLSELQVWQRATELLAEVAQYCCQNFDSCNDCPALEASEKDCGAVSDRLAWAVRKARAELEVKPDGN